MKTSLDRTVATRIPLVTTALIGALPAAIFYGRVTIGIFVGLVLMGMLLTGELRPAWRRARDTALSPLGLAVIAAIILWVPSLATSPDPLHSLETIARSAAFLLLAVMLWHYIADAPGRPAFAVKSLLVAAIVGSCLAAVAIEFFPGIYLFTHLKAELPPAIELAYKQTGSAALLMLPLACYAAWRFDGRWRWLAVAVIVALFAVMFLTGNRAGIAGLVGTMLVVGVIVAYRARRYRLIALALIGFVVLGAAALAWNEARRELLEVPAGTRMFMPDWIIDWHRQHIWITTWEIGGKHPWFGAGVNEIDAWPSAVKEIGTSGAHSISFHPHNWILEIGAETGLISLAWMLVVLLLIHQKLLVHFQRTGSLGMLTAIAISSGYWISGLFNFSYWSSWWMVTFYACMALGLALAHAPNRPARYASGADSPQTTA